MLEFLLLVTLSGVIVASRKRMGFANPFQIYFFLWLAVLGGYYLARDTFINVSADFFLLLLLSKTFAFVLLIGASFLNAKPRNLVAESWCDAGKSRLLLYAQILVILALPLAYKKAVELAGGQDIFSVVGYVSLRAAQTQEGQGFGLLSYLSSLSLVVSSVVIRGYYGKGISIYRMILAVLATVCYVYLSTGRTFVLFFIVIVVFPLVLSGIIRARGLLISFMVLMVLFVGIAAMTGKGVSVESGFGENVGTFLYNLRGYTFAPLLAFYKLVESAPPLDFGANSFRFVLSVLQVLGLSEPPPALIRDYASVPDLTNVYTVYEVYFRDFSYAGVLVPPAFLMLHWWLYQKARFERGIWVFYYSASMYPLLMQFFQDQYFSLLSTWIQIAFWFWVLLGRGKIVKRID